MRRIFHISDLHFGRVSAEVAQALRRKAAELQPDLVIVSGDLTQRARRNQFRQARRFLDALGFPKLIVPGNHDIPLDNLFARLFRPLARYREYISSDLAPTYLDDEIAVFGVNTARSLTRARGTISDRQIEQALQFFCNLDPQMVKIVVTHHPFDLPETFSRRHLLRRAQRAIQELTACQADLYLAGHAHIAFARPTAHRYTVAHHTALIIQAGTCVSTRTRSQPNSFNLIRIERPAVAVEHFHWTPGVSGFNCTATSEFVYSDQGWRALAG